MIRFFSIMILLSAVSCKGKNDNSKANMSIQNPEYKIGERIGTLEKTDAGLDSIAEEGVQAEVIAKGFEWSEGCLWIPGHEMLLFSDIPRNRVYKWTALRGAEVFLEPSGYTGEMPSESPESGSNGLALDREGRLLLCQHGNRQVVRMDSAIGKASPLYKTLAANYKGKRFNSPNDLVCADNGDIYFTDPPYGLPTQTDMDPKKEMVWNGVYKIKADGAVILLADSLTRPNGIGLFPGENQLLVANSDENKAIWYLYDIKGDKLENGRIFYSVKESELAGAGLPDGLKITKKGYVIATGPEGIYFFSKDGKKLGLLPLHYPASNCALSEDEKTLYITNDGYVLRVRLRK